MAMTKLNFFDKHVEDENSNNTSEQANIHLNLKFQPLSGLAKLATCLLWCIYLNIQLSFSYQSCTHLNQRLWLLSTWSDIKSDFLRVLRIGRHSRKIDFFLAKTYLDMSIFRNLCYKYFFGFWFCCLLEIDLNIYLKWMKQTPCVKHSVTRVIWHWVKAT